MLQGNWTYRSYLNDTALVGNDANKALNMIFGEGVFNFVPQEATLYRGTLDMGSGFKLTLRAVEMLPSTKGAPTEVSIVGLGIDGTPTAGWQYDYRGVFAYKWPEGVKQVRTFTGTVIRVKAHGPKSPAGFTASFVAIAQGS